MKKLLTIAILLGFQANAELIGTVTKIVDGDTIHAQVNGQDYNIRMYCIDTPESKMMGSQKAQIVNGQNYGLIATSYLKTLISIGDKISIDCKTNDKYGRSVCEVFKGTRNINYEMVASGYAVVPKQYCKEEKYYTVLEIAKSKKLGLFAYGEFQDPANFRRCVRSKSKIDCNL